MTIGVYETLVSHFEALSSPAGSPIQEKVNALASYIHKNAVVLAKDLSDNRNHAELYARIKTTLGMNKDVIEAIKRIQYLSKLESLKLVEKDPEKLAAWLNSSSSNILDAFDAVKKNWKRSQQLGSDFDVEFSKRVVSALGLEGKNASEVGSLFKEGKIEARAVAYVVNANSWCLGSFGLSIGELNLLAPHLHYVNVFGYNFKDNDEIQNFLANCSSAFVLSIRSDKLKELKQLPATLEELNCCHCAALAKLSLSNLLGLKEVTCQECTALTELSLSNLPALEKVLCIHNTLLTELTLSDLPVLDSFNCQGCTALTELSLSNFPALKEVCCRTCTSLTAFEVSNLPALEKVYCYDNASLTKLTFLNLPALKKLSCYDNTLLTELTLSNLPALENLQCQRCTALPVLMLSNLRALEEIDCRSCTALQTLTLSNLPELGWLDCSACRALETIRALSLPNCRHLNHAECPLLTQLPQLPNGGTVISYDSIGFTSFEVDADDLIKQPLEVLCHLGEFLLRDKRIPNIVYLGSEGLDAGGLRRQLVTTLLKHLFEEGSPLEFTKEHDGVLPLLQGLNNKRQVLGFKTIGALAALASLGSLPLGKFFKDNFFYALLNLDLPLDEKKIYRLLYTLPSEDEVTDEEIKNDYSAILAIATVAEGFQEIVGEEGLKRLRELEFKEFVTRIAGEEITWDNFKNKAVYTGTSQNIERTKEYFHTFFNEKPEKLADMIELFTGSRALGTETIKIFIEGNKANLFDVTTCFQQIKVPPYETYDTFRDKLLKTCEHVLGRFDRA